MAICITCFLLVVNKEVSAWGVLGHRVTGGIADTYLNTRARAKLKQLLGTESLAMATNWADFIKSDRKYDYISPWHYINISSGKSREQVMQLLNTDTSTNLFTKISFIVRELKSSRISKEQHVFFLKLLLHFVGDAHQPMHMGRPEDRGGNGIKLYWFGEPTNLHRLWDEQLVEFQQLSYTEHVAAINFPTPAQKQKWQKQPLTEWIYESYQVAQKLYTEVRPEERLSWNYNYYHVDLMNEQLLKGGIRLAALLNDIYGK